MTRSIVFFLGRRLPFTFFYVFALSVFSFGQNPIVIENGNPGNPSSEWSVPDFRDNRIAGFSTKMSLNRGQTVRFKINVQSGASYTLRIYRLGYYQGNGARLMQNLGTLNGTVQPNGISDPVTGLLDCSNWSESASWNIPATAVSGLYIAKLERSGGGSNHIVFIVRNDASNSDLYLQFPDARWQAYNGYGGNSMYDGNTSYPNGHAVKASYNRPFFPYNSLFNIDGRGADWYMNNEYPMIRWLELNGYDVTYTGSNDIARNPGRLFNHKVFISIGHDEYWSKEQRDNVEAARNGGVHLAFFAGNEVYWKTRWESNDGTEDRTLICYKEGLMGNGGLGERACGDKCDVSSSAWTGLWRTGANYDAGKPENALTGQISWTEYPAEIRVPSNFKKIRFWRNTSVPNLSTGQSVALGENTLGYEWDYEQPAYAGNYPAGRFTLSSTTVSGLTHKLSLYRHSSGALVFGAGTVQWSWGLDGSHWGGSPVISPDMQQATVNLFADMGAQPGSLQAGLTQTTQSTDFTSPTSTITSPSNNGSFLSGSTIVISGTAADGGGGVVAGMEISVNGGITWNSVDIAAADGNINWSYTWVTGGDGTFNIKTRGVDDSGNKENPGTGINIVVGAADNTAPTVTSVSPTNGSTSVGIGTNVTANFNEAINGSTVTGTTFQLRAGGNLVSATVGTSSNQVTLTPNATLTPSTTYTVTITGGASGVKDMAGNALASNYSWSFTTSSSTTACPCNVFQTTAVPDNPLNNDGQGIELGVRFRSTQNGFISGIRYYKGSGTTGAHIGHLWSNTGTMLAAATFTNETASGWQQVLFSSPVAITAGVTYVASQYSPSGHYPSTVNYFTQAVVNGPLRGLADGEDGLNGVYAYSAASAFPTFSHQSSNYWVDVVFASSGSTDNTPPTVTSVSPLSGATGVSVNAQVTANFSEAVNSSTVTGTTFQLRDAGNILITSNVSTASGQITLTPSAALAGSTVYTVTIQGGASGVKDLAGNALANNYSWSFTTASVDNTAPTVTSVSPTNGSTSVGIGTNVTANFNEAINGSTVTGTTFQLRVGGNLVSATVGTSSNQVTLTPNATLTPATTYTVTITGGASGVKDMAGNALASNYSWSFTTSSSTTACPCNVFQTTAVPDNPLNNDGQGIELGVRFRSTQNGFISGIRYYKGSGTTGAHIGHLWSNTGTMLAAATFTNETESGWQQVLFSSPVAITAGVTYVASQYSPSGHYPSTVNYFTQAVVNGPLRGLADGEDGLNGVYAYSAASAFPTFSHQSSNYWVDVVFASSGSTDNTPPTVTSVSPLGGATGVSVNAQVTANFSEAVNSSTVTGTTFQLRDAGNNLVTSTIGTVSGLITLTPSAALAGSTVYTVTIQGGASGVKDLAGNALANNYSWSFTTASVDNTAPTVTSVSPTNGSTGVGIGTSVTANFSEAINGSTVTGTTFQLRDAGNNLITSTVGTASGQITLTPSAALAGSTVYTVTIQGGASGVKDLAGNALATNYSWSFTTASVDNTAPTVTSVSPVNASTGVSIGATVTANFNEAINGSTVTGTTFQLRTGGNLVSATVNTSSSQVTLTPNTALTPSTTYTVTITGGASGVKDLAGNSLATNYSWSFSTIAVDNTAPVVSSVSPVNGATGVSTSTTVTANFSEAINASTVTGTTVQLKNAANVVITAVLGTSSNQLTLTPSVALTNSTVYTITILGGASGVKDLSGNALANNYSWTFTTTAAASGGPITIFQPTDIPQSTRSNDGTPIELGVKFRSTQNGLITGIRYYKGVGTTGVHLGNLWSRTGTRLAQATFTNETASGWQQVLFANPVAITAGVTYVASYFSPSGDFAASNPYLDQAVVNGPLRALANGEDGPNGLWNYTTVSAFPANGHETSNYWADVVFVPNGTTPTVTAHPASQTVCVGTNVSFTSAANGDPAPTVQWQSSTNGTTWTNVSGATTGNLTFGATAVDNNKQYRAVWSNSGATVNSNVATLTVNAIPGAPTVSVSDNCGNSVLTASGFTGSLVWSNGATTASITVTSAGTYTVRQTVNGCVSPTGSGVAAPVTTAVTAPAVNVVNNCGNSVLTASGFTGSLLWSNGATTSAITVTTSGTYTVTQKIGACISPAGSGTAAPLNSNVAAPAVNVVNNCGNSVLTASGFTGSLLWSNGATTPSITVAIAGTYTVTQTVGGCTSPAGSGTAAPVVSNVVAPSVSVVNNCGNSVLTASGFTGSLLWSNGATTPEITVTNAATYTVTQTVGGCTSPAGSGLAAPKATPSLTSSLTATFTSGTSFIYTPASTVTGTTYTWTRAAVAGISNAAANGTGNIAEALINTTSSPINVTYAYNLAANGCTSNQNVIITINPFTVVNCTISNTSLTATFNATSIPAGRYIWFNSSFDPGALGTGTDPVTMKITNSVVSFTANNVQYTLNVPDARVRFDATVTSASTQFVNNVWETVVPRSFSSYIFMGGLSYQVPVNFPGNIANVRWSTNISFDKAGISLTWRWSAAVYTTFAAHSGVNVKPISGNIQNPYLNSDRAGTPENFKLNVVAGARGAGGTNYNGNFVNSATITCSTTATRASSAETLITNATRQILGRRLPEGTIINPIKRELEAAVMPNPSSTFFTLSVKGSIESPVTVRIVDIFGQEVERYEKIAANSVLHVGHKWSSGSYFAEVTQGTQRKIVRIIKAR